MVTRRLLAERRTWSVRRPKTGVLPTVLRNQPVVIAATIGQWRRLSACIKAMAEILSTVSDFFIILLGILCCKYSQHKQLWDYYNRQHDRRPSAGCLNNRNSDVASTHQHFTQNSDRPAPIALPRYCKVRIRKSEMLGSHRLVTITEVRRIVTKLHDGCLFMVHWTAVPLKLKLVLWQYKECEIQGW